MVPGPEQRRPGLGFLPRGPSHRLVERDRGHGEGPAADAAPFPRGREAVVHRGCQHPGKARVHPRRATEAAGVVPGGAEVRKDPAAGGTRGGAGAHSGAATAGRRAGDRGGETQEGQKAGMVHEGGEAQGDPEGHRHRQGLGEREG